MGKIRHSSIPPARSGSGMLQCWPGCMIVLVCVLYVCHVRYHSLVEGSGSCSRVLVLHLVLHAHFEAAERRLPPAACCWVGGFCCKHFVAVGSCV